MQAIEATNELIRELYPEGNLVEPPKDPEFLLVELLPENFLIKRAIEWCRRLHPANPVHDIPGADIIIACHLYGLNVFAHHEQIVETIDAINQAINERQKRDLESHRLSLDNRSHFGTRFVN